MNRRGFFARAAAVGAGILASCSPRLVGLAQAQEPSVFEGLEVERLHELSPDTYESWNVGFTEVLQSERIPGEDAVRKVADQFGRQWYGTVGPESRVSNALGRVVSLNPLTIEFHSK